MRKEREREERVVGVMALFVADKLLLIFLFLLLIKAENELLIMLL